MEFHTPENSGSGQVKPCIKCKLSPDKNGHDGCLGELQGDIMNACCGHGRTDMAYIQYWGGGRICGEEAIAEQKRLISIRD